MLDGAGSGIRKYLSYLKGIVEKNDIIMLVSLLPLKSGMGF
jgi:hypothetical protein